MFSLLFDMYLNVTSKVLSGYSTANQSHLLTKVKPFFETLRNNKTSTYRMEKIRIYILAKPYACFPV